MVSSDPGPILDDTPLIVNPSTDGQTCLACTRTTAVISVPTTGLLPATQPTPIPTATHSTGPAMYTAPATTQRNAPPTMDLGGPTALRHFNPPDTFLGQRVDLISTDPALDQIVHLRLNRGNGPPGLPSISFDSRSTGLQSGVSIFPSLSTDVPGTGNAIGDMATRTKGPGRKRARFEDDAGLERDEVGKRKKLRIGNSLPAARAQQLGSQGFQVAPHEYGPSAISSQGYDIFGPIHQPPWQGTGVAGPSGTKPTALQVVSKPHSGGVPPPPDGT